MSDVLQRLRERKLVQWALAYIAASFALIQVLDIVAQRFGWPEQTMRFFILAVAIGFFVTLVVAWYHGERGVQRVSGTELLILAVLLAIGGAATWKFGASATKTADADVAAARSAATIPNGPIEEKSIAVLPLVNESGDTKEDYFSDGLSEDLITALSQFAGLKVISRNSSFQFRNSKDDSHSIGQKLGVAHLLEGSVRRAGDVVRISATLVRAMDGTTAWSQHYDRPYQDLFKLQDDITEAVAASLKAKLLTEAGAAVQTDRPASGNLEAYNLYLQGHALFLHQDEEDVKRAIDLFAQATRIDPTYARAYAESAFCWILLGGTFQTGADTVKAYANAHVAVDKALALDPTQAYSYVAKGRLLVWNDFDWAGSAAAYLRASELAPNDDHALSGRAESEAVYGRLDKAIEWMRRAIEVNALYPSHHFWLSVYLAGLDRLDDAEREVRLVIQLQPSTSYAFEQLAQIQMQRGDAKAALETMLQAPPSIWRTIGLSLVRQLGDDRAAADAALKDLIDIGGDSAAIQIAETYALRKDPVRMFEWLERAWTGRDPALSSLLYDPLLRSYRNDSRYVAFLKKVGLLSSGSSAPAQSGTAL